MSMTSNGAFLLMASTISEASFSMVLSCADGWGESRHRKPQGGAALFPRYAQAQPALDRAAPILPGRVGRRVSGGPSLCVGLFHFHTPSSVAAAIATAARRVALRISLRTAVLAHVWSSFSGVVMALSFDLLSRSTPLIKLENGCDATRIPL